ncbi:TRAP transporter large permease [Afifella sp. H1R]|uniref:TRAP transporter large permease n=1 Tax=unclassified Afifella TaxID=2624128 RepID=UPI001F3C2C8C|nr:TRAP transporter large permease subunit [Afifella sp. H1R]MCF1505303.1 TRAP transporter large permease subunit [Afifella sp. H1R]
MIDPLLLCLLMFVAACGLLTAGFPVAFTLAGTALGFALIGSAFDVFSLSLLTAFPQSIFGTMTNETLVAVPLFVFMGVMLERSRIAEELLDNMGRLFGSVPGGLAFSVCIVGALLAASTGIVGATVVTMGLMSLPTMVKRGYNKRLACGTIAASGTLGQIIPPSIVLVLLGDQLSVAYQNAQFSMGIFAPDTVSVNDLFAGALLPGFMLVGLYIVYQIIYVFLHPAEAPAIPHEELGELSGFAFWGQVIHALAPPVLLIVAVLGSILIGLASPTEAAGVGAIGATMLAGYKCDERRAGPILIGVLCMAGLLLLTSFYDLRSQRSVVSVEEWVAIGAAVVLTLGLAWGVAMALWRTFAWHDQNGERVLAAVCQSTMAISAMVFTIIIGARMFSIVFIGLGGADFIEEFLTALPGGTLAAILLVMLVMFVMGFFLDFLEIVFIVVPIVAPILLQMEMPGGGTMSPVWLGIMMAVNLQTSFLTPPFGFALFYLRGVAPPDIRTTDIYRGIVPFVCIQVFALVLLWFLPDVATWLPLKLYGN